MNATYAGASSILMVRPSARAALPSVASVTEVFEASSRRSTAARLVFMRTAISVLVSSLSLSSRASWRASACFMARSSTSSKMPSSFRKSRKSLPRWVRLLIQARVQFSFAGQCISLCESSCRPHRGLRLPLLRSERRRGAGRGGAPHGWSVRNGEAPLSPALSPFVPHGARETDAVLVRAVSARIPATSDRDHGHLPCARVFRESAENDPRGRVCSPDGGGTALRVVAERRIWSAVTCHRFGAGDLSPSNFRAAPVARACHRWREL